MPLIPIAIGAATIGGGVSLGLRARDFEQQADEEPFALDAKAAHDQARSNARLANVLFATGGAILATGTAAQIAADPGVQEAYLGSPEDD